MKWINAVDLCEWADRIESRAVLPELIRRLIYSTTAPERLDFPSGDGVQNPGWDGLVESRQGNQFVPSGLSGWELSCERRVGPKAESDYCNRCGSPGSLDPRTAAFVFVTARRWSQKREWMGAKSELGTWANVRAYDADDLEQWLDCSPSVAAWLASSIGKYLDGARALDDWWRDWSNSTRPAIVPALLTAGRTKVVGRIELWLRGQPGPLKAVGDTTSEAIAFLAASIAQLPPAEVEQHLSRALVLGSPAAVHELGPNATPLILVLTAVPDPFPGELSRHHTYIALSRGETARLPDVPLEFQRRREFESGLVAMGLSEAEAPKLAHEVGCSISALRRRLAATPLPRPAWAAPESARGLLPALLAGGWDETRPGDIAALAELAGEPYETFAARLRELEQSPDAPVRASGSVRRLISIRDVFLLIAPYLTSSDLSRFQTTTLEVLGAPDPRRELDAAKRWMASVYGKERPHSETLRQGLAASLLLLSVFGESAGLKNAGPADFAAALVAELVDGADAERWHAISDVIPTLSEAAPDAFLSAVEASLDSPATAVISLFEEVAAPFGPRADHSPLLWALEGLAWERLLLGRVSLVLARLDARDPGGKLANRPAASLRNIFLPWKPQTAATLAQRQAVITMLLQREPEASWKLLLSVAPTAHDFLLPNQRPQLRGCPPEREVSHAEWFNAVVWLADRLADAAGRSGARWAQVMEAYGELPQPLRQAYLKRLASVVPSLADGRHELCAALRKLISRNRRFCMAEWALPPAELDCFMPIYNSLAPTDPVERMAWLFGHNPTIIEPPDDWQDHKAFDALAQQRRASAVIEIAGDLGAGGIVSLALAAPQPQFVGVTCAEALNDEELFNAILDGFIASADAKLRIAGRAMVATRFIRDGWAWADPQLARGNGAHVVLDLLLVLPIGAETWRRAADLGPEIEGRYWAQTGLGGQLSPDERSWAVEKLLGGGRALDALCVAALDSESVESGLAIRILKTVPTAIAAQPERADADLSWYVERLFARLDGAGVDKIEVAKLEWPYLSLMSHWGRPSSALHDLLARDAAFFAELIAWQFKPSDRDPGNGEDPEPSPEVVARARAAHGVLSSWKSLPGKGADGSLDGERLRGWISQARRLCKENDRARIGDEQIGAVLARAPSEPDGNWPAVAVREIVESANSQSLESGLEVGVANLRGVHSRKFGEGGEQERELARKYRAWAEAAALGWPRTSAVLERIARHYEQLAGFHDRRSE